MNVYDILKHYLIDSGYDGLHLNSECGCLINDLIACGADPSNCVPGYKVECPDGYQFDWLVCDTKNYKFKYGE